MSGFMASLKGAIFEDETPVETKIAVAAIPKASPPSYVSASVEGAQKISPQKMKQALLDELAKNIVGSPYAQFQKISAQMKTKIADTSTRCMATGAAMEAQNIHKADILLSAKNAVTFLTNESVNFQNEVSNNILSIESQFNAKSASITSSLEQKQNQIKALSEEISQLQKDRSSLEVETAAAKTKFEVSKIEFTGSLDSILQEVNTDINDITNFIGV